MMVRTKKRLGGAVKYDTTDTEKWYGHWRFYPSFYVIIRHTVYLKYSTIWLMMYHWFVCKNNGD